MCLLASGTFRYRAWVQLPRRRIYSASPPTWSCSSFGWSWGLSHLRFKDKLLLIFENQKACTVVTAVSVMPLCYGELGISSVCGECSNIMIYGKSCPRQNGGVLLLWLFSRKDWKFCTERYWLEGKWSSAIFLIGLWSHWKHLPVENAFFQEPRYFAAIRKAKSKE